MGQKQSVLLIKFDGPPATPREVAPMVKFIASQMDDDIASGTLADGTEWAVLEDEA